MWHFKLQLFIDKKARKIMQFVINEKFPKTYAIQYYDTSDSQKLNNFTSFLRREIFIDKKFLTHFFLVNFQHFSQDK